MSLIKCIECGKEISDKAKFCINCGCPLSAMLPKSNVEIKLPDRVLNEILDMMYSITVKIMNCSGEILWKGSLGENADFYISEPTRIFIELSEYCNTFQGTVYPDKKYKLEVNDSEHRLKIYKLIEII